VVELSEKLDREMNLSYELRGEINDLKAQVAEAKAGIQNVEDSDQAYYDQGFDEAANSLKSQLAEECNKYFIQGWRAALDRAGVYDAFELYDLGPKSRPFRPASPEDHEEEGAAEGPMDLEADYGQIPVVEV
jgi:hypothetical protein